MKTQNREEIFLKALADGKEPEIKPLTRKEVLLKKQSKRESEGPHWNDIEGKPFGETLVNVLPLSELSFAENDGAYVAMHPVPVDVAGGEAVRLEVDGIVYDYEAKSSSGDYYAGNSVFMTGEDSGEKFTVIFTPEEVMLITLDDSPSHEVKIDVGEVKPLAGKFLDKDEVKRITSNMFGGAVMVVKFSSINNGYGWACDTPYKEVKKATQQGLVIGKVSGRTFIATQNYKNSEFVVDFCRFAIENNEGNNPHLKILSLYPNENVVEGKYGLTSTS